MRRAALSLGIFLSLQASASGVLPEPFSATVAPEWRSAYQARGLIIEDRPVLILPVFLTAKTTDFGSFGVWTRQLSSLTDRKEVQKSQYFYERDWAARWRYDLTLAEGWRLRTTLDKVWMTFWNYRAPSRGTRDHTLNEWRLREELRNPYLTPYAYLRRGLTPAQTFYAQLGVFHDFELLPELTFTPQAYVETGNAGLMRLRYGARTDDHGWRGGIQTANIRFDLTWKVNDVLRLTAGLHQFATVNEPARSCIKAKTSAWSRRDLTIFSLGVRLDF